MIPDMGFSLLKDLAGLTAKPLPRSPFARSSSHKSMRVPFFGIILSTKYWDDDTKLSYYGHRYYGPATGTWLSRDPIGESGGKNLCGFVHGNPISRADGLGLAWNWVDFVLWYYVGGRQPIDLASVGLLGTVQDATKGLQTEWWERMLAKLEEAARNISCPNHTFASIIAADAVPVNLTGVIYVVGHTVVTRSYECSISADCSACSISYSCTATYSINDSFSDPGDPFHWFEDDIELFGDPYDITALWTESDTETRDL